MTTYIDFSIAIMDSIVDFVSTAPIFYIFGLVIFGFVIKAVKDIISYR